MNHAAKVAMPSAESVKSGSDLPFLGNESEPANRNTIKMFEIPDAKTGPEKVDAVVVDSEAVDTLESQGTGARILRGEGALEHYLAVHKEKRSLAVIEGFNQGVPDVETEFPSRAMSM